MPIHVAKTGNDSNPGTVTSPVASLQRGIDLAGDGDAVIVASGVYGPPDGFSARNYLQVIGKSIALIAEPGAVLDLFFTCRGIWLADGGLELRGWLVRNAFGKGFQSVFSRPEDSLGGAIFAYKSKLILIDCVFDMNVSQGNNVLEGEPGNMLGGLGVGGAVGAFAMTAPVEMTNVRFLRNKAFGGHGGDSGNYGQGGGFFSDSSDVVMKGVTFWNNQAAGGSTTNGSGIVGGHVDASTGQGATADGQGGAFDVVGGTVSLSDVVIVDCQVFGGDAPKGTSGGGFGGGCQLERAEAILDDVLIRRCLSAGGQGGTDSQVSLGSLNATNSRVTLSRVSVLANQVVGGKQAAGKAKGSAGGGGIALSTFLCHLTAHSVLVDCVVAGNSVAMGETPNGDNGKGGGGGGLWMQGVEVDLMNCVIDGNSLLSPPLSGSAFVELPPGPSQAVMFTSVNAVDCKVTNHATDQFNQRGAVCGFKEKRTTTEFTGLRTNWYGTSVKKDGRHEGLFTDKMPQEVVGPFGQSYPVDPKYNDAVNFDYRPKPVAPTSTRLKFDPASGMWFVGQGMGGVIVDAFQFGGANWVPLVGKWDGIHQGMGVFDPATCNWYLRNGFTSGPPDTTITQWGVSTWQPVVGDWDGSGRDSIGMVDPSGNWHLRHWDGSPDTVVGFSGPPGIPLVAR